MEKSTNNKIKRNSRHHIVVESIPNSNGEKNVKKLTIKTRPAFWINTSQKIIFPFSINSPIYESNDGVLKISTLLKLVRSKSCGNLTVLLCEKAHMHILGLKYGMAEALKISNQQTSNLFNIYKDNLVNCEVNYWKDFVEDDDDYGNFRKVVSTLYQSNDEFKTKIRIDAEKTYTKSRAREFQDKLLYIKNAELDLLEQCIYLLVAVKKGYKFEFYPGKRIMSAEFVNNTLDTSKQLVRVNVTLGSFKSECD